MSEPLSPVYAVGVGRRARPFCGMAQGHPLQQSSLARKLFPMPFRDDLNGAIHHFDCGLVINRIGWIRETGCPFFGVGHRIFWESGVIQVRENRKIHDA
jgi:hypothetical protein